VTAVALGDHQILERRSLGTNSAMIGAGRCPVETPSTAQQNACPAMISA
jgi:hypothetical protein